MDERSHSEQRPADGPGNAAEKETSQPAEPKNPETKSNNVTWMLIGAAIVVIIVLLFSGGGYGKAVTQDYTVDPFQSVHIESGVGNLVLAQSDEPGLQIEAPEKYIQWITATVEDNVLTIDTDRPWFQQIFVVGPSDDDVYYRVSVADLNELIVDGVINADTAETLTGDDVTIMLNGAADIDFDLAVTSLNFELNGAGSATMRGSADTQSIVIDGAGNFDGSELVGNDVTISINGAGDADVHATNALEATIDGAGNISYYGNPENVTENLSGVGSISPANDDTDAADEGNEDDADEDTTEDVDEA